MAKLKGEFQADNGDILYPHTSTDVVFTAEGKTVAKEIQDMKTQIAGFPTSLPANGGNADTVDGKHAIDFPLKSQGIGAHAPVWSGSNLNDLPLGSYTTMASGVPEIGYYHIVTCQLNDTGDCGWHFAMCQNPSRNKYFRTKVGNVWSPWERIGGSMGLVPSDNLKHTLISSEVASGVGLMKYVAQWIPPANGVIKVFATAKCSSTGYWGEVSTYMGRSDSPFYTGTKYISPKEWSVPIGGTFDHDATNMINISSGVQSTAYATIYDYLEVTQGVPVRFYIYANNRAAGGFCNSLKICYDEVSL